MIIFQEYTLDSLISMKVDSEKSHGKVFVEDGEYVNIWDHVSDILEKYRSEFIK